MHFAPAQGGCGFYGLPLVFVSFVLAQIWQPIPEYTAEAKIQLETNQSMASLYLESFGYSVGGVFGNGGFQICARTKVKKTGGRP